MMMVYYTSRQLFQIFSIYAFPLCFLATLVALHLTPVSKSVSRWAVSTSVASSLASLLVGI